MEIFGREVTFRRDWGANIELAKLCPGHDIGRIGELFAEGDFVVAASTQTELLLILSEASERYKKYIDPLYEKKPLTEEEILLLDDNQIQEILSEAMEAMGVDSKTTVETKPVKKRGAKEGQAS